MDRPELKDVHGRVNQLYREASYGEALELLDSLRSSCPNDTAILYARALCLAALGRFQDASASCDHLIRDCHDFRGVELSARIAACMADIADGQPAANILEMAELLPMLAEEPTVKESAREEPTEEESATETPRPVFEFIDGLFTPLAPAAVSEQETVVVLETPPESVPEQQAELEPEDRSKSPMASPDSGCQAADSTEAPPVSGLTGIKESLNLDTIEIIGAEDTPAQRFAANVQRTEAPRQTPARWRTLLRLLAALVVGSGLAATLYGYYAGPWAMHSAPAPVETHPTPPPVTESNIPPPAAIPPAPQEFPSDLALGAFSMRPEGEKEAPWKWIGSASGALDLPAEAELRLDVAPCHALDFETLASIKLPNLRVAHITHTGFSDNDATPLGRMSSVRELTLSHTFLLTDAGLAQLVHLPDLESLTLQGVNLATDEGSVFLAGLKKLRSLDLSEMPYTDDALIHIEGLAALESLALPDGVTDKGLMHLSGLSNLRELRLGAGVSGPGLDRLARLQSLEKLTVKGAITEPGMGSIAKIPKLHTLSCLGQPANGALGRLTWSSPLRNLELAGMQLSAEDINLLANLPQLASLRLDTANPPADGVSIIQALAQLPALTELNLNSSTFTDAALESLPQFANLQTLGLSASAVTSAGMARLAPMAHLAQLTLDYTAVNDSGLQAIGTLTGLQRLSLIGVSTSDAAVQTFQAVLPQCEIVRSEARGGLRSAIFSLGEAKGSLYIDGKLLGLARGPISWPEGASLRLVVSPEGERDLTYLDRLPVDALDSMKFTGEEAPEAGLGHIGRLTGLESLTLRGPHIGDAGLALLKDLRGLKSLALEHTSITDASLASIAQDFPGLEHLSLPDNERITDAGIRQLASLGGLQSLNLDRTPITGHSLASLRVLLLLTDLSLVGVQANPEAVEALKRALPECAIHIEPETDAEKKRPGAPA